MAKGSSVIPQLFPLIGASATAGANNMQAISGLPPVRANTDTLGLSDLLSKYGVHSELKGRQLEGEIDPALAKAREAAKNYEAQDILSATRGEMSPADQRANMTEALMTSLATGGKPDSTFGQQTVGSIYGRLASDVLNNRLNRGNAYLAQNQGPSGGLDPSVVGNIKLGDARTNLGLDNAYRQELANAAIQGNQGVLATGGGIAEQAAQEQMAGSKGGGMMSTLLPIAGTVAGGIFGGGPLGAMIGGAAGSMLGKMMDGQQGGQNGAAAMNMTFPILQAAMRPQGQMTPDPWSWSGQPVSIPAEGVDLSSLGW